MCGIQERVSNAITTSQLSNKQEHINTAIKTTQINSLPMRIKKPIKASGLRSVQQPNPQRSRQQPKAQPKPQSRPAQVIHHANIQLKKGQRAAIDLQQIIIGARWLTKDPHYDLDVDCFALTNAGKVVDENYFVFYGNPSSPDGSIRLISENLNLQTGDCKEFALDFCKINPAIERLVFVLTINEAFEHRYNFSKVSNAVITVRDMTRKGIFEFTLTDYYDNVASMVIGEIYYKNSQWKFHSVGSGIEADLAGLCARYGVEIC